MLWKQWASLAVENTVGLPPGSTSGPPNPSLRSGVQEAGNELSPVEQTANPSDPKESAAPAAANIESQEESNAVVVAQPSQSPTASGNGDDLTWFDPLYLLGLIPVVVLIMVWSTFRRRNQIRADLEQPSEPAGLFKKSKGFLKESSNAMNQADDAKDLDGKVVTVADSSKVDLNLDGLQFRDSSPQGGRTDDDPYGKPSRQEIVDQDQKPDAFRFADEPDDESLFPEEEGREFDEPEQKSAEVSPAGKLVGDGSTKTSEKQDWVTRPGRELDPLAANANENRPKFVQQDSAIPGFD